MSGPRAPFIAESICDVLPEARRATLALFRDACGAPIDQGLVLHFPAPHSYTGESVVEFQGHGGPMVLKRLLARVLELGARPAQPGEFTCRAFLNDRIDLAQAEGVADLIEASSEEAARSAALSMVGEFSSRVTALGESLSHLRMHVEACIDFPEEEIDPADRESQARQLAACRAQLQELLSSARQGSILREGLVVVLVGRPNVGKSSLLNRFAGDEVAIVTPVPGTTRDYVRATIHLEGVPVHFIDTAGLRDAADEVERIGVERSWKAIQEAGALVFLTDSNEDPGLDASLLERLPAGIPVAQVRNKVDLSGEPAGLDPGGPARFNVSAKTGAGVEALEGWLLDVAGWKPTTESVFLARARHLVGLREASSALEAAAAQPSLELVAEDLRRAQESLGTITGEVSADEILGRIFSAFCIGK